MAIGLKSTIGPDLGASFTNSWWTMSKLVWLVKVDADAESRQMNSGVPIGFC
jgi:hypothetical protein